MAFSACGGAGADAPFGGATRYDLVTDNGVAPPIDWRRIVGLSPGGGGYSCDDQITGQQLYLGIGTAVRATQRRLVCDNAQYNKTYGDTASGTYQQAGSTVTISLPNAIFGAQVLHAQLSGGSLTVNLTEITPSPGLTSFDPTVLVYNAPD